MCNFDGLCDGIQCWFGGLGILCSTEVCVIFRGHFPIHSCSANGDYYTAKPKACCDVFHFALTHSKRRGGRLVSKRKTVQRLRFGVCLPTRRRDFCVVFIMSWFSTPLPNPSPVFPLPRTHSKSPCVPSLCRTTKFSNKANP